VAKEGGGGGAVAAETLAADGIIASGTKIATRATPDPRNFSDAMNSSPRLSARGADFRVEYENTSGLRFIRFEGFRLLASPPPLLLDFCLRLA
jgi:hypothetical protein